MEKYLFICSGGTIDKDYPRLHSGYAFEFGAPAVERIVADLALDGIACDVKVPFQKDSTEITAADRAALLAVCLAATQGRIVVTHGTDTLIESAAFLGQSAELAALGKTIVFTGAMRPERFTNSDAKVCDLALRSLSESFSHAPPPLDHLRTQFNVGVAFGALECAAPGVYVAMCGRVRKWDAVERDLRSGKFVALGQGKAPMVYRTMPGTEMEISLVSLGCFAFGGGEFDCASPQIHSSPTKSSDLLLVCTTLIKPADKPTGAHNGKAFTALHAECWGEADDDESIATVRAALDAGINVFDNAEMYGDGYAEAVLGRALSAVATEYPRSSYYIFTKISEAFLEPSEIEAHLDASLARLQTDYIDLYQLHWHSRAAVRSEKYPGRRLAAEIPLDATLKELTRLRDLGKILHIGVCNFGPLDTAEAVASGVVVSNQVCYNLAWRGVEETVLPLCRDGSMGVLAWSPLLQGILSGKFATVTDVPGGRARTRLFSNAGPTKRPFGRHGEAGHEEALFTALAQLRAVAERSGESLATLALAWVATRAGVTSILMGARNPAQVERNLNCLVHVAKFNAGNAATVAVMDELTAATDALYAALGSDNLDPYESGPTSRIK